MSMPQEQIFANALSLPQPERAELAFQLLLSLDPPGTPVDAERFSAELQERVSSYRRGTIQSHSLDEARAAIRQRLSKGQVQ